MEDAYIFCKDKVVLLGITISSKVKLESQI